MLNEFVRTCNMIGKYAIATLLDFFSHDHNVSLSKSMPVFDPGIAVMRVECWSVFIMLEFN